MPVRSLSIRGTTIVPSSSKKRKDVPVPKTERGVNKLLARMRELSARECAEVDAIAKELDVFVDGAVGRMESVRKEQNGIARALYLYRDRLAYKRNRVPPKTLRFSNGMLREQAGRIRVEVASEKAAVKEILRKGIRRYLRTTCVTSLARSAILADRKAFSSHRLKNVSLAVGDLFVVIPRGRRARFSIPISDVLVPSRKR